MHSSYQQNFGPASSSPQQSLSRPKNHSRSQSQSYESRTMDLTDMHPPQSPDSFHSSSVQGHSSFGQKPREVEIKEEKAKLEKNIVKLEVKMEKKEDEWKLEREKLEMKIDKKEEEWKLEREKLEKERKEEREKLEKERKEEREKLEMKIDKKEDKLEKKEEELKAERAEWKAERERLERQIDAFKNGHTQSG
ncbi:hypothetical protein LENED_010447 [Lentinula edodes]|uniref:Uncharacterized protein n=1 Tax=Lentinula edodes TaxID=5353 RepID=A0A1Q3EMF9_LENED|nr:hypothetical protein LENED_010447 [Lentinula edodes]